MGYRELLPQVDSVSSQLNDAGLSPQQRESVLAAVGYYLEQYSDFYHNEYQRVGERQDQGAHEALNEIAQDFLSESRYATATD